MAGSFLVSLIRLGMGLVASVKMFMCWARDRSAKFATVKSLDQFHRTVGVIDIAAPVCRAVSASV
jgi:hypothetical protein